MTIQRIAHLAALSGFSATALYAAQPPVPSSVQSDGFYNTAMGTAALSSDTTPSVQCVPYAFNHTGHHMSGCANTASGIAALQMNTTGFANTASGAGALRMNTAGSYNTAVGSLSMYNTTQGIVDAAFGTGALFSNTNGSRDSALGAYALFYNTTGAYNTASGHDSMFYNLSGNANTASGNYSLLNNLTGNNNVAIGMNALNYNLSSVQTSSSYNTAVGSMALYNNTTASRVGNNTAVGYQALTANGGVGNTALGASAGLAQSLGNYNSYLGFDVEGVPGENYVTRIGVTTVDPSIAGTPTTFIAGISTAQVTGAAVYVTSSGQLGVLASSERYKTDIIPLGGSTDRLLRLRPVSFHLKSEPAGTLQYGLIAEEVDKVYPELVIRDAGGTIQGVRYDELAPMLLNEMQRQHELAAAQAAKIDSLEQKLAELNDLKQELKAALRELQAKDSLLARQ